MADRYWIGGSATWDATTTANWSTTSGGTAGASVPTASDSVFFDRAGVQTITLSGAVTCLDFNVSGTGTFTFAGTGTITISGSMNISRTPTWSAGAITFNATTSGKTITSNGMTFTSGVTFNGTGGVWTLGGSFTSTSVSGVTVTAGTLDTSSVGNYALSLNAGQLTLSSSASAIINLNNSTVTLGSTTPLSLGAIGIFNAGTSQINITQAGSGLTFSGAGKTFYNVAFTGLPISPGVITITGANTYNNLSFVPTSGGGSGNGGGYRPVTFAANQIINGVLSTSGTAGNNRVWFQSDTIGIIRDLTINGTPSITDMDFRDIRVIGTASPISGTRLGNNGGASGITFTAPKTVYWSAGAGGNWSANVWALSSGGAASTDNFPLAQDTVIIDNTAPNAGQTITLNALFVAAFPTVDASGRTSTITLDTGINTPLMFGDLKLSSTVTMTGSGTFTFAGRNTQTITSAGRTFTQNFTIDSLGGIVNLADAMTQTGTSGITVTNGTFNTNNFALTAVLINSNNTTVRAINLGSSSITLSGGGPITIPLASSGTPLTFNAGTSTITFTSASAAPNMGGLTLYNVVLGSGGSIASYTFSQSNTFQNLTFVTPTATGNPQLIFGANQTINGTLSVVGGSAIRRITIKSNTVGIQRTINCGTLTSSDCDFIDIAITGAAINTSPTRAGNCGNNSGIIFPASKTVYWNLGGAQTWSSTGWATSSGGTPAINNFPLAQDTAIFDDTGAAQTFSLDSGITWNIGTVDMSARTTAMTFATGTQTPILYGNWKWGSGVTISGTGVITFGGRGTQVITSNGKTWTQPLTINNYSGIVQLADALTTSNIITHTTGTLDAATYNVTITSYSGSGSPRTLKMGTGIWTLSGTGTVWLQGATGLIHYPGTATIVLSDTSTTSRTFTGSSGGGPFYYNKLTIGGTTGTSTTTIDFSVFGELASTKTVAHTVSWGSSSPTIGKWSITGTAGNLVTVTAGSALLLAGDRVSGVDYLTMGTTAMFATNPVEFYAGANSTGTGSGVIKTAAPAAVTRYWVGGTGTWDATTTTNWSATSGGAGGASVPTSADTVIFDGASSATAYTVTLTATQLRCASLSVSGPATGSVTFAGTAPLSVTQSLTIASTGVVRTWTGTLTLGGTGTGKTISASTLGGTIAINSIGGSWALSAGLTAGSTITLTNGSFDTAGFALSCTTLITSITNPITLSFGASTISCSTGINFTSTGSLAFIPPNFTFNCGSSSLNLTSAGPTFYHGGETFNDITFAASSTTLNLHTDVFPWTCNNLSIGVPLGPPMRIVQLRSSVTVTGTLTFTGTAATSRCFVQAFTVGSQQTLSAGALSGFRDVDFRDINCTGTASWSSGTRIGDCGGNGGSFVGSTPKTVYWNLTGSQNWSATGWATSSGGAPDLNNFPLAQDTAIFDNAGAASTVTMNANWNVGTVDLSARTSAMTVSFGTAAASIHGDWKNGSGVAFTGSGSFTFRKRGTQTITSNGRSFFIGSIVCDSATGTLQLADAITCSGLTLTSGTFDAVNYNVTISSFGSTSGSTRTLSMGSGLWSVTATGTIWQIISSNLTFNKGTANILLTDTTTIARTFAGGGLTYNKLTIGGSTGTSTLTISDNNTFFEIASTKAVAHTISLGTSIQTVNAFTARGLPGAIPAMLSLTGSGGGTFATLIYTGTTYVNLNYITATSVKVYDIGTEWYIGPNSTNGGSYGFIWSSAPYNAGGLFFAFF